MIRQITVVYEIHGAVKTDVFVFENDIPGAYSIAWDNGGMSVTWPRGAEWLGSVSHKPVFFRFYRKPLDVLVRE